MTSCAPPAVTHWWSVAHVFRAPGGGHATQTLTQEETSEQ